MRPRPGAGSGLRQPPRLVVGQFDQHPSKLWLNDIVSLRHALVSAGHESQISFQRDAYNDFAQRLDAFRERTLQESPRWARHYLPAIDVWRQEATKLLGVIEERAECQEPITPNVYSPGDPLRVERDADLFLGREDLHKELSRHVNTTRQLPLLLIQGQRRVGKTSLLNFLPKLLPPAFIVVQQDLQAGDIRSVPSWLDDLRRRAARACGEDAQDWSAPAEWVAAWNALQPWLVELAGRSGRRLILAFDEYEYLHRYLRANPDQGDRLLAAMRSFSQQQTRVCLLFAGATPFSELRSPDWARFFVQAVRMRVDYLDRDSAVRLITEPVPTLRYPAEVPARLFELTQGHPALLQRLCKELVDIANGEGRRDMTAADLDQALERGIDKETAAMERFWNEFCTSTACRGCIEDVLAGGERAREPGTPAARIRLSGHGYIAERNGTWKMRVPLFEDWLRRYRQAFDGDD